MQNCRECGMFAVKIIFVHVKTETATLTRELGGHILAILPLSRLDSINNDMSKQTQSFSVIIITLSPQ